jgi:hypothetical protein
MQLNLTQFHKSKKKLDKHQFYCGKHLQELYNEINTVCDSSITFTALIL